MHILAPPELAPLGHRSAVPLHEVQRKVHAGGAADAAADPEAVRAGLDQGRYRGLVQSTREDDLHIPMAMDIQAPPHLPDDLWEVPAAGCGGVQPDPLQVLDGFRGNQRLGLFVRERVGEDDPGNIWSHHLVERFERRGRLSEHDDEGVRHGAVRRTVEHLRPQDGGHTVASADIGRTVQHRRDGRMRPPNTERDHRQSSGGLAAAGGHCRHAGGVGQHPQHGGFMKTEL